MSERTERIELTAERLAELRRTQYSPVEALRQYIDGAGGLRERMDEGDVTAFEADVVMGYDALQDVIAAQADEIERLRQAVDVLQLDRRTLEDVISVLEQEQRRAGRYLEDARDELAHGRIQSAEHRIVDALVSLSSKERRTDTRLKTAVKSGGGCD